MTVPVGAVVFDRTLTAAATSIDTGAGAVPAGYRLLAVYLYLRSDEALAAPPNQWSNGNVTVNGDTSAVYDRQFVSGGSTNVQAAASVGQSGWALAFPDQSEASGCFGTVRVLIPNYDTTSGHKVGSLFWGVADATAANCTVGIDAVRWRSTAAISRVAFTVTTGGPANLIAGTRMTVLVC